MVAVLFLIRCVLDPFLIRALSAQSVVIFSRDRH